VDEAAVEMPKKYRADVFLRNLRIVKGFADNTDDQ